MARSRSSASAVSGSAGGAAGPCSHLALVGVEERVDRWQKSADSGSVAGGAMAGPSGSVPVPKPGDDNAARIVPWPTRCW